MVGIDIAASRARLASPTRGMSSGGGNALAVSARLLRHGYITLAGGPQAEFLTLTPALTVAEPLLEDFVDAVCACL
jgi:4-aminobutyrate aminotransferase-like enzyme